MNDDNVNKSLVDLESYTQSEIRIEKGMEIPHAF